MTAICQFRAFGEDGYGQRGMWPRGLRLKHRHTPRREGGVVREAVNEHHRYSRTGSKGSKASNPSPCGGPATHGPGAGAADAAKDDVLRQPAGIRTAAETEGFCHHYLFYF